MQVFRLSVSVLFSHLYTCNPYYLPVYTRPIGLPVSCYCSACLHIIRPSVSTPFARIYPYYFSVYTHIIRRSVSVLFAHLYPCYSPPLYMLFAYPYTRRYLSYADTQTPHAKKTRNGSRSGAKRSRVERGSGGGSRAAGLPRSPTGPVQGSGVPDGQGSLPLAPSYLRPRGWRYRRWCAPPAGAWQTPERSAPAPAPAPSPWPAQAGGGGKMMKRRRRKVRRSTAYSRLPGAPGLTGPSCSSSAKGRQSLCARLGGR